MAIGRRDARTSISGQYGIEDIDTHDAGRLGRIARSVAAALNCFAALLIFGAAGRRHAISGGLLADSGLDLSGPLADTLLSAKELWELADARAEPTFGTDPLVKQDPGVRFCAGTPLLSKAGDNLGILCAVDREPRQLSSEERQRLQDFASLTMDYLELQREALEARRAALDANTAATDLREVIDQLPMFVTSLSIDGRVLDCNDTARGIAGVTMKDLHDRPFASCPWWLESEDGRSALEEAIAQAASGAVVRRDVRMRDGESDPRDIDLMIAPLRSKSGDIVRLVASGIDIGSRKATERALRQSRLRLSEIFLRAGVGIAQVSMDDRWLMVNDCLCQMLGYSSEELASMTVGSITHPEDISVGHDQRQALVSGEISAFTTEKRYISGDGSIVWGTDTFSLQRDEAGRPLNYLCFIVDATERRESEELRRLLIGELNHRVKNLLAMVQSIANQSMRLTTEPQVFAVSFRSRIQALSRAHDQLTKAYWKGADLESLITDQVILGGAVEEDRFTIEGPNYAVSPQIAINLALALHELASNALKFGALSVDGGHVTINWNIRSRGDCGPEMDLSWTESGGPPVTPPDKSGFGSTLLQRGLEHGIGSRTDVSWRPEGLAVRVRIPIPEAKNRPAFFKL